jgi:hypothetical protein
MQAMDLPLRLVSLGKGSIQQQRPHVSRKSGDRFLAYINHVPGGGRRSLIHVYARAPFSGLTRPAITL